MAVVRALRYRWLRFRRNDKGLAALEFALILPIMVVLYLGGFEVSEAVIVNHKVTHATSVLGDLVAQEETITNSDMTDILAAVSVVINPYPVADFAIVVSGVKVDSDGIARVVWSDTLNGTALAADQVIDLPTGLDTDDTFLVMAQVSYTYTPQFGQVLVGNIDLADQFYLRPRYVNEICRKATTATVACIGD